MRLTITDSAARAAMLISVAARAFLGLSVDAPATYNGAWLSALLAVAPAGLWLICLDAIRRNWGALAAWLRRSLELALLALLLADGGDILSAIARSAGYLALDRLPVVWLAVPACMAALWCAHLNGDALGYGAMLGLRLFAVAMALVVALQARYYRPAWLRPVLGDGARAVADGTLVCAGWYLPPSALLLVAKPPERNEGRAASILQPLLWGAGIAALLLLLRQMMMPAPIRENDWYYRLDTLLTNGRAPLYLQLPMIALWHFALIHLFACESFVGACLLQRLAPSLDGRLCALAAVLAALSPIAAGLSGFTASVGLRRWAFPAIAALTAIVALSIQRRNGGSDPCASGD